MKSKQKYQCTMYYHGRKFFRLAEIIPSGRGQKNTVIRGKWFKLEALKLSGKPLEDMITSYKLTGFGGPGFFLAAGYVMDITATRITLRQVERVRKYGIGKAAASHGGS